MNKVLLLSLVNVIVLPIVSNIVVQGSAHVFGILGLAGLAFDYHITSIIQVATRIFDPLLIAKKAAITIKWVRHKLIRFLVVQPEKVDF